MNTSPVHALRRSLMLRVRVSCLFVLVIGSLLPPYVPKAALAPQEDLAPNSQFLLVEDGFLMKTSAVATQTTRRAYANGVIHTVEEGDSLERLAARYGISVDTIRWANKLVPGTAIQPGQDLLILPVDGVLHTVTRGQTLIGIAELYGVDTAAIAEQNQIQRGFIVAGQELIIPGGKPIVMQRSTPVPQKPPSPQQPSTRAQPESPAQPSQKQPPSYTATPTPGVLQKPCSKDCFITQYYHAGHYALDMQERGGGDIYAAEAGIVRRAEYGWNGGYGNVIEIDHGNGLVTLYGHNRDLLVKEGDTVARGQKIANMGNTGLVYGKTGIHVHFEVQLKGVKKNPLLYIQ